MWIFPPCWPFVRGIHRWPVDSPHKIQWRGALVFSLICAWTNGWAINLDAGDLRNHRAYYDVIVMYLSCITQSFSGWGWGVGGGVGGGGGWWGGWGGGGGGWGGGGVGGGGGGCHKTRQTEIQNKSQTHKRPKCLVASINLWASFVNTLIIKGDKISTVSYMQLNVKQCQPELIFGVFINVSSKWVFFVTIRWVRIPFSIEVLLVFI